MLQLIRSVKASESITWVASGTPAADIKATGAITRIVLRAYMTMSGSIAGAVQEDGPFRIIQTLKVRGAGGVGYFSMGDEQIGRLLHLLNMKDKLINGVGHGPMVTTQDWVYVLHFGSRPKDRFGRDNPFDLTAFIPAFDDSSLQLEWGTTANNVVDDTVTISSGVMYMTVYEVLGTAAEIRSEMARQGIVQPMIPVSSYRSYAHTGNLSDLSAEFDVPVGAFLRRIALLDQDATATRPVRVDDGVARVGLKLPVGNQRIFEDDFRAMVFQQGSIESAMVDDNGTTGGAIAVGSGFAVMDFREQGHSDYGLNLRPYKNGDVKLGLTIENYNSGDDTFIWYDQVRPYSF